MSIRSIVADRKTLFFLVGMNMAAGLVFQLLVLKAFGAGFEADALFGTQGVPNVILAIFSAGLMRTLIPLLLSNPDRSQLVLRSAFICITTLFAALALILVVLAPLWVRLTLPGFDPNEMSLAITLAQVQSIMIVPLVGISVLTAGFHAKQSFADMEAAMAAANLVVLIIFPYVTSLYGIHGAAWLWPLRYGLAVVIGSGPLYGIGPAKHWQLFEPEMLELARRSRPLFMGSIVFKSGPIFDRGIASFASPGFLALLTLVQAGYSAALVLFDKVYGSQFNTEIATCITREEWRKTSKRYSNFQRRSLFGGISVTAVILAVGILILLGYMYCCPEANTRSVFIFTLILIAMSPYLPGGVNGQIAASVLYSAGETKALTKCAMVGFISSLGVRVLGFIQFGGYGLATGIALYQVFNAILLHRVVSRLFIQRLTK